MTQIEKELVESINKRYYTHYQETPSEDRIPLVGEILDELMKIIMEDT